MFVILMHKAVTGAMALQRKIICFLLLLVVLHMCASEPLCSKYDYDEKMLERMIQVQFDVKQFATQMENVRKEVNELQAAKSATDEIRADVNRLVTKQTYPKGTTLLSDFLLITKKTWRAVYVIKLSRLTLHENVHSKMTCE